MDIFGALRESHEKQRTLIQLLLETEGDSDGRAELLERLKQELDDHAMAEERHFYVHLMERDLTQEKARHSVAEHQELDELVEKLEATDFSSPGWLATARKLADRLIHHLDEEEREVFQLAGKVLSEPEKESLAEDYEDHMDELARE